MTTNESIIAKAFQEHRTSLLMYVSRRINNMEESADIVQDVFLRILSCDLLTEESIKSLCYTIANNLVIDHIRRHYKRQEVYAYAYETMEKRQELTPEQIATFHDLAEKERCAIMDLSPATARVYEMTRMEGKSIEEIAEELNISRRTVECHQFKARKMVRMAIRNII